MPDRIRPVAIVVGLLLATGACASEGQVPGQETDEWGPLAVFETDDPHGSSWTARSAGTLVISDRCATLSRPQTDVQGNRLDDAAILLVWPSAKTAWDAQEREIVFQDPLEGEIRLEDGDVFEAGGGGIGLDELDSNVDWLAEPHSSCPTDAIFVVGDGEVVED